MTTGCSQNCLFTMVFCHEEESRERKGIWRIFHLWVSALSLYWPGNQPLPSACSICNQECMKIFYILIVFSFCYQYSYSQQNRDVLFHELNKVIAQSHTYDQLKVTRIDSLKRSYQQADSPAGKYEQALRLYDEYKIYQFDSAFTYASIMEETAVTLNDESKLTDSRKNLAFILLSAGKFSESFAYLQRLDVHHLPDSMKADYFTLMGRYYHDLADYNSDDIFSPRYRQMGNNNFDSALAYIPAGSFEYLYYSGLKNLKQDSLALADHYLKTLLKRPDLTIHQTALVSSTLSYFYVLRRQPEEAINYQIRAAMADIRSSTKETVATFNLAQLLYEQGDFERASIYIQKAIDDASFYGARQRKVQVSAILPIIQGEKISYIERQRKIWLAYALIVTLCLFVFAFLIFVIYKQFNKLKKAEKVISEARNNLEDANSRLKIVNGELQEVNNTLQEVNGKLQEANKIKEEYIGYFFNINSAFFEKMDRFKRMIEQKIADRKLDELRVVINNMDLRHDREDLLKNFDEVFLKLFPTFVEEFNALFEEDDKIVLKNGELLNNELRIYALMRMGITENEKIAQILEYSVKTIYAYKTKIRNRTRVPKEDFDNKVMSIKSI